MFSMARAGRLATLLVALALAACDEDPFVIRWEASPDTAVLYSLARAEFALPSAFNFSLRSTVSIERPGAATQWDVALDTRNGQLVFVPPGALGITSRARVAEIPGQSFENVEEAPADTLLYSAQAPVPLQLGSVYIVRTDARSQTVGGGCSYYAKLEPLAIDTPTGYLQFVFDISPVCNDRRVVPPDL